MRVEIQLDKVDRGRLWSGAVGCRVRVDAVPEKRVTASVDRIQPHRAPHVQGWDVPEKLLPCRATLKNLDPRLRPGMSASGGDFRRARAKRAVDPVARQLFSLNGKPTVYTSRKGSSFRTRTIAVGRRNDEDLVVSAGLERRRDW